MKLVEKALYELLKTHAVNRVYALRAPQDALSPYIVFQRTDSDRWRSINNPSGIAQAYIQVDAYAGSYYAAKELEALIETTLDGFRGDVQTGGDTIKIAGISLQNDLDLLDQTDSPLLFRNSASYKVTYHQ